MDQSRRVLGKLIDCIRFCDSFQLTLRGHDEAEDSLNPGAFRGLVDLTADLDSVLAEHLANASKEYRKQYKMNYWIACSERMNSKTQEKFVAYHL